MRATAVSSVADASVAYGVPLRNGDSDGGAGDGGSLLSQTTSALDDFADGGEGDEEEEPEWWYSLEGEQLGPVTAAELALLVQALACPLHAHPWSRVACPASHPTDTQRPCSTALSARVGWHAAHGHLRVRGRRR